MPVLKDNFGGASSVASLLKTGTGSIKVDGSLNDYPQLTIVEYGVGLRADNIGSVTGAFGLTFVCDSCVIKKLPDSDPFKSVKVYGKARIVEEKTSSYVHASKAVYEAPIKVRVFVEENRKSAVKVTDDSLYFPIGKLVPYARRYSGGPGTVNVPSFIVKLSRFPGEDETVTLKDLVDGKVMTMGKVYSFDGATLSFKTLGAGGAAPSEMVGDFSVGSAGIASYKDTLLTWDEDPIKEATDKSISVVRLDGQEYITYEGDYNPHVPPPSRFVPRDLSPVADIGGITKEFKITKYKYGQPEEELEGVFGYAHAAIELVSDPARPNNSISAFLDAISGDPTGSGNALQEAAQSLFAEKLGIPSIDLGNNMVWRLISIKRKKYNFQNLNLDIKPKIKNKDGTFSDIIVPKEYEELLKSNIQVLTEEETTGWELRRFQPEDSKNWTAGSVKAWLELKTLKEAGEQIASGDPRIYNYMLYRAKCNLEQYLWRKIPIWERIRYAIEPYAKYYKDSAEIQWDVQYIPKNSLPQYKNSDDDTEVPVLFPDADWSPGLMITSKNRYSTSVAAMGNPNFNPFQQSYYEINPTTIISGSEEIERVQYGILPSKNTNKKIGSLFQNSVSIAALLSKASSDQGQTGTYYQTQPFTTVSDYGLASAAVPNVPVSVPGSFPTNTSGDTVDRYVSYSTIKSASDNSFKSQIATSQFFISEGRPPQALTRKPSYDTKITDNPSPYRDSVTYISSNSGNESGDYISSISIPGATNKAEAIAGAKFKLIIDQINASNGSAILSFASTAL